MLLFVENDISLLFINCLDGLISCVLDIAYDILGIIIFSFLVHQVHDTFLLFSNIDWWSISGKAPWWVVTEAEEISKCILDLLIFSIFVSLVFSVSIFNTYYWFGI